MKLASHLSFSTARYEKNIDWTLHDPPYVR